MHLAATDSSPSRRRRENSFPFFSKAIPHGRSSEVFSKSRFFNEMRPALTPISSGLTCVRMTPSSIGVRLSSASAFLKITFSNPYARSSQLNRDSILNDQQVSLIEI